MSLSFVRKQAELLLLLLLLLGLWTLPDRLEP
jgi:hypothetical protein